MGILLRTSMEAQTGSYKDFCTSKWQFPPKSNPTVILADSQVWEAERSLSSCDIVYAV